MVAELIEIGQGLPFHTVSGKTVCTNDFYEGIFQSKMGMYIGYLKEIFFTPGQARLDGAFCSYSEDEKLKYLEWLREGGVSNIEMESTCFAALTHQAGIRSAIVCVTLLDRLNEDQVCKSNQ